MNPLVGLYRFPRGENIGEYRTNFETFNDTRNLMEQNWYTDAERDMEQNPWLEEKVIFCTPAFPFFVVIRITPLAACEP